MVYQEKEVEILSIKKAFGIQSAVIRVLSTGEIIDDVPLCELSDEKKLPTVSEISFKAIAAKIKSEVFKQSILAWIMSNVIPFAHQILALVKVMSGQFIRYLIADEVGMGK